MLYDIGKAAFQSKGAYFLRRGFSEVWLIGRGGLNELTGFGISKKLGMAFKSDILSSTSSSSS